MGWTRISDRVARDRRRPVLESLETRQLLSELGVEAVPAAISTSDTNSNGSTNFDQIIGASATRSTYGVDGSGSNVAVIDTGVNYQNSILGGSVGAGKKVVSGVDFTNSPTGLLPTWQHGTGVAGLIAGNGSNYQGVAPGAGIIDLRVFGDNNQGSFANIEQALTWVVQNHAKYNITAVNLSISDGGNYTTNEFAKDGSVGQAITGTVNQLDVLNIPVVVAAGNSFNGSTQGMGFPAVVSNVISVTATDASDKLASNAQRLSATAGQSASTTIAAPGVAITAPGAGNTVVSEDGTSFATPQVTGSIVLLQQMYEKAFGKLPTVAQLENWLEAGSMTIHDDATNTNLNRLDVLNSADILAQQIASVQVSVTNASTGIKAPTSPTTPPVASVTVPAVVHAPLAPTVVIPPVASIPPAQSAPAPSPTPAPHTITPPVQTPTVPTTEVFYNGISIGNYSSSHLSSRYPNLFSFFKGPVQSIQIYGPKGFTPNLGASQPTGTSVKVGLSSVTSSKASSHAATTTGKVKAMVVRPTPTVVSKAATSKKHSSIFSTLFHFPF